MFCDFYFRGNKETSILRFCAKLCFDKRADVEKPRNFSKRLSVLKRMCINKKECFYTNKAFAI